MPCSHINAASPAGPGGSCICTLTQEQLTKADVGVFGICAPPSGHGGCGHPFNEHTATVIASVAGQSFEQRKRIGESSRWLTLFVCLSLSLSAPGTCSQCSCVLTRDELMGSKENGGEGLTLGDKCPAMFCLHPVSSHQKQSGMMCIRARSSAYRCHR